MSATLKLKKARALMSALHIEGLSSLWEITKAIM